MYGPKQPYQLPSTPAVQADDCIHISSSARGSRKTTVALLTAALEATSAFPKRILVDAANGDDTAGQRENLAAPFATISAAIASAEEYDLIIVNPGSYTLGQISKQNIIIDCLPGVTITCSAKLIDDTASGTETLLSILGKATIISTITGTDDLINLTNALSNLYIECQDFKYTGSSVNSLLVNASAGSFTLKTVNMSANAKNAFYFSGTSAFQIYAHNITSVLKFLYCDTNSVNNVVVFDRCVCEQFIELLNGNLSIKGNYLGTTAATAGATCGLLFNDTTLSYASFVSIDRITCSSATKPAVIYTSGIITFSNCRIVQPADIPAVEVNREKGLIFNNVTVISDSTTYSIITNVVAAEIQNYGILVSNVILHPDVSTVPASNAPHIDAGVSE